MMDLKTRLAFCYNAMGYGLLKVYEGNDNNVIMTFPARTGSILCGGLVKALPLGVWWLVGPPVKTDEKGRKGYLCTTHYKEYKKRTKKDREIERLRFTT